jgi:Uma2 family endonuclease
MSIPTIPTTRLTYEALLALQELPEYDGLRLELIEGELFVSAAPNLLHQYVSKNMTLALGQYVRSKELGVVFAAPTEVRLAADTAVQPDFIFVSRERMHILKAANIEGAPDLVIEILSPSNRRVDLIRKKAVYERLGVLEYWIVDPDTRSVAIFALVDGRYVPVPIEADVARSRVVPGFAIALSTCSRPSRRRRSGRQANMRCLLERGCASNRRLGGRLLAGGRLQVPEPLGVGSDGDARGDPIRAHPRRRRALTACWVRGYLAIRGRYARWGAERSPQSAIASERSRRGNRSKLAVRRRSHSRHAVRRGWGD